jgi:hypothetical protein
MPLPEVLGATITILPETGFSNYQRIMFSLFIATFMTGMFVTMVGSGLAPRKLEEELVY